jgi:protein ImuA
MFYPLRMDLAQIVTPDRPDFGPPLALAPGVALAWGRVHEITGPARRTLAAMICGAGQGTALWFRPAWDPARICPQGFARLGDPGRVLFADCARGPDVLWGMEEALRSGAVGVVLGEVVAPPDLRQIRRLHLAAAEGAARAGRGVLGVVMQHDRAESAIAGVETRWALAPDRGGGWRITRLRARGGGVESWVL